MKLVKLVVLSGTTFLSACGVSQQEANNVDYGARPEKNEQAVINLVKESLKDPDSLKVISITNPSRGFSKYGFGSTQYGWFTTVKYNAKNSYGGYVGAKESTFVYLSGGYNPAVLGNANSVFLDKESYSCKNNCSLN